MTSNESIRPRRSVLYMPASNQRAMEKAKSLAADAIVLDLEDAVGPDKKAEARSLAVAAVQGGGYGNRELVIRVNGLDTPWGVDDLKAVAQAKVDTVCLPKVESAGEIRATINLLDAAGAPKHITLWAMIETPLGVMQVDDIAASSARLSTLVMGTTDLAKELRVPHTADRIGLQYALSRCVMSARANDKDILDGVYIELDNPAGYRAICEQGRDLGFDGKTLIHPSQIEDANTVFGPSAQAIDRAHKILAAWEEAEKQGKGVVVVDGKLVEGMHIDEAKRLLAIADRIAQL